MKAERTGQIAQRADKAADIEMAISSEAPVERWFGYEVLRHTKDAIDLSRLNDGRHPLLLNHNTEKQIGVMTKSWLDDDKKLRGKARFSASPLGQEIKADVDDEIRTLISVGYMIDEIIEQPADGVAEGRKFTAEEFEREMRALHGENFYRAGPSACRAKGSEPPTYVVTRWQPFEVSVVPIPADVDVGVGRAAGAAAPPEVKPATQAAPPTPTTIERIQTVDTPTQKKPEELERDRTAGIMTLGEQYSKYVDQKTISDAIRNGRSVEQFRETVMEKMASKHTDTSELQIGMERKEVQRYSLCRAVVASITGDWSKAGLERSASQAMEKLLGHAPGGFYVPYDAFKRDFNVGTGSEAGNLVATELRTDLFVDVLRNNLVLSGLGIRILAGLSSTVDIPKKTVAGTLGMVTEIQALTETNPNTGKVTLSPKRMGAFVEYSKQALIQASMPIEGMLRDDLLQGLAVLLQDQVINGSGSGANMRGIRNTSGIGSVVGGTNGLALAWTHIVDLESACANVNAEPDRLSGYCVNTKFRGTSKKTQKGTNLPFIWDSGGAPLNGYRAAVTNTVPSNLTKGTSTTICSSAIFGSDWSMSVLGLFGAPDIVVDPFTLATTGQVRITLNQFADHQVRLAACFATSDDLLTP